MWHICISCSLKHWPERTAGYSAVTPFFHVFIETVHISNCHPLDVTWWVKPGMFTKSTEGVGIWWVSQVLTPRQSPLLVTQSHHAAKFYYFCYLDELQIIYFSSKAALKVPDDNRNPCTPRVCCLFGFEVRFRFLEGCFSFCVDFRLTDLEPPSLFTRSKPFRTSLDDIFSYFWTGLYRKFFVCD